MEQRELIFRSAHYYEDGTFNGFTFWGLIDLTGEFSSKSFSSPVHRSGTTRKIEEQYTSLKDKNDLKLWEGDVVKFAIKKKYCTNGKCEGEHNISSQTFCPDCGQKVEYSDFVNTAYLEFEKGAFCLVYKDKISNYAYTWKMYQGENFIEWIEKIGDIHNNPEFKLEIDNNDNG